MKIRNIILTLLSVIVIEANAAKVIPVNIEITLADDITEVVHAVGDEHLSFYVNDKNEIFLCENDVWHKATQQQCDSIKAIGQEMEVQGAKVSGPSATAADFDIFSEAALYNNYSFPHKGTPKVLVLLVDFPDRKFTFTREELNEQLNGEWRNESSPYTSFKKYYNYSSIAQYFEDSSNGMFRPQFEIHGTYTLPYNSNTYRTNVPSAVEQAMKLALADGVDVAPYDNDNNGTIDLVYILHAGYSSQFGGDNGTNKGTIWPACWTRSFGTFGGKSLHKVFVCRELSTDANVDKQFGRPVSSIGVACHELSHALGLSDLYATVSTWSTEKYDNQSMEDWDLMDNGENIDVGFSPIPYSAAEKAIMGWSEPLEELNTPSDVTMKPLIDGGKAYRVVNPKNTDEQWILEVFPKNTANGWYKGLPQKQNGLLITHCLYDRSRYTSNTLNNEQGKPRITIIPADDYLYSSYRLSSSAGSLQMTSDEYAAALAGDLYPGTKDVTSLSSWKADTASDDLLAKTITDIAQAPDGSVTFKFMGGAPAIIVGDADDDGEVTMNDANIVANYFLGSISSIPNIVAADVDGDGSITMSDANGIVNIYLGINP